MTIEQDSYRMILNYNNQKGDVYNDNEIEKEREQVVQTLKITDTQTVFLIRKREKTNMHVPEFLFQQNKQPVNLITKIKQLLRKEIKK